MPLDYYFGSCLGDMGLLLLLSSLARLLVLSGLSVGASSRMFVCYNTLFGVEGRDDGGRLFDGVFRAMHF